MKGTFIVIGICCVFGIQNAIAADELSTFSDYDADRSGYVSQNEAEGNEELINNWSLADENGDGLLDMSEFSAFESIYPDTPVYVDQPYTFDDYDADGSGYISQYEAEESEELTDNWDLADENGDGMLDISEFSAFESMDRYTPAFEMEEPEPGAAPTE